MHSIMEEVLGMERYEYLMGLVDFDRKDLRHVVDAINHLRSHSLTVSIGTYTDKGDLLRLPIGVRCRLGTKDDVKIAFEGAFDACGVTWKEVTPSMSLAGSLKAARAIDAAYNAGDVTIDEITPPSELDDAFVGLVGRDEEIKLVKKVALATKAYGRDALESLHMILLGNPGVGKTEFAYRVAQYYRKQGVISGKLHKISAADLISEHVGSAPRLVRVAFDQAKDGILFIDEAYALSQGDGNEFGVEAVNTMVECMDSRRDEVIVIAAGYYREMNEFLSTNPGLRARFGFELDIKDYSVTQLGGIYKKFAETKGFAIEELDDATIESQCKQLMEAKCFAGARTIRKAFTESVLNAAVKHPESRMIVKDDLEAAVCNLTSSCTASRKVGFI